ncbi:MULTISPECIES: RteC domain-containing protein [Flavobacterium]|uniref:Tetracycline regulation of excision, RteC n=1 Tax=Flavobacterium chungangense TaxID=554283 RepID=A0A6V6YZU3_9FLAO|nr:MULTISPECIES: RteC domain-containing protein [Flavobacterium]CAD0004839.1 hypothetical protein FLACHUCJ7_02057 [Flavobacterium chungangense]
MARMEKFYVETLRKLETEIHELEIEADCSIQRIEIIVNLIVNSLYKLKMFVLEKGFKNTDEEIHFFKYKKPVIVSKLIYYNTIYKIETKKTYDVKLIIKYLNICISVIKSP